MRKFVLLASALLLCSTPAWATTITFSEPESSAVGFNGQFNQFFLTSDGQYRVEAFWLGTSSHFHDFVVGGTNGTVEANHNQSGGAGTTSQAQGVRISRVDGQSFDLLGMDLFGQVSVGQFSDLTTGAGSFALFNGSATLVAPGPLSFGSSFTGLTAIYLADPFVGGGTSFGNAWDNVTVQASAAAVPEPATMVLLGTGLAGFIARRRRSS
jgi:PEP-CTERM motif